MSGLSRHVLATSSIVVISVIAYLPAVDNSFISDDFGLFPMLKALEQNPAYIFDAASELFRVISYVYFWICFKLFGMTPEPFYWAGIALHAVVSLLVYLVTLDWTKSVRAALAAAVFFAAYERHQEAVMWISAANETVLTLNCLLFLFLWHRMIGHPKFSSWKLIAALGVLAVAFFSKEAAVVLVPLAILDLRLNGFPLKQAVWKSLPLLLMLAAFVALWLSQAHRNFFVTDGHYAFGWHFVPVYARSLLRLILPAIPFAVAILVIRRGAPDLTSQAWRPLVFFAVLLVLAILPYSFLTYLDHLPSRNTYLPSVGLAGMIGILFASLYKQLESVRSKQVLSALMVGIVTANVAYIWLKKEPQFRERAAPTRELIDTLNSVDTRIQERPIYVCGFPLHPWVFSEAIAGFTRLNSNEVRLLDVCTNPPSGPTLQWDEQASRYVTLAIPAAQRN